MMPSRDHLDWSDTDCTPDPLLLRLLGAVDQDQRATVVLDGPASVIDEDEILALPPGTLPPSVALARLRRPVES